MRPKPADAVEDRFARFSSVCLEPRHGRRVDAGHAAVFRHLVSDRQKDPGARDSEREANQEMRAEVCGRVIPREPRPHASTGPTERSRTAWPTTEIDIA